MEAVGAFPTDLRESELPEGPALVPTAVQVPGYDPATTALVVASLTGAASDVDPRSVDLMWTPRDIIDSWRP